MPMASDDGYLLDNRQTAAGARLGVLAAIFDPWTFRHIEELGLAPGGQCWEVGAGGPSVARRLAGVVGPAGRVLATDIDVSWAQAAAGPTTEVRRHDVARDDPPEGAFDLVHARLVLVHVTDRAKALATMVAALRPGGLLLVEDADPRLQPLACLDEHGPAQRLANRIRDGFRTMLAGRGADLAYGRTLPRLLREAGLSDVAADVFFPMAGAGCARLEIATIEQIRGGLVAGGHATDEEIDRHLAAVRSGSLDLCTAPMVSAWGRRPV